MHQVSLLLSFFILTSSSAFATQSSGYEGAPDIEQRVNQFVGIRAYQSLLQFERNELTSATTRVQPWSGSYWPLYQGQIAYAYADREPSHRKRLEPYLHRFWSRMDEIQKRLKANQFSTKELEHLSPSEKYDLFLGDHEFTLTRAIWNALEEANGKRDRKRRIKDWEGICHGWAAASAYSERPTHKTVVKSLDGKFDIPFFPDDLKALSTLLWANSLVQDQTKIEGLRCNTKKIRHDSGSGKITTTRCKGVNPGVFHLTVLGMIGTRHLPFIINKNNDEEIWNQPAFAYQFQYYNIQTGAESSLQQAAIPLQGSSDQFRRFRPQGTTWLVGVQMELKYSSETDPSHQAQDSTAHDSLETMSLRYDLELDAGYNVLGGEWTDAHSVHRTGKAEFPGFLWRFNSDTPYAASIVDFKTPEPSAADFTPAKLVTLSKEAASFRYNRYNLDDSGDYDKPILDEDGKPILNYRELRPQPIAKVINYLVNLSNR